MNSAPHRTYFSPGLVPKPMTVVLCCLLLLSFEKALLAKPISFDDGHIRFDAPDDFTPLTPDEIAKKFPMKNGTMNAIGNANRGISISYSLTSNAVRPEQLDDLKNALTGYFHKLMPNAEWVKDDYVDLNGTRWIILETITPTAVGKIHNLEIATSYRGVMLVFNFNAAEEEFDANRDHLWACLHSVTITGESSLSAAPISPAVPVSADQEVARGQAALREGHLDLAYEAFGAALIIEPGKPEALAGQREVEAAKQALQKTAAPANTNAAP